MPIRATGAGVEIVQAGHLVRASGLGVEAVIGPETPPAIRATGLGVEVVTDVALAPIRPTPTVTATNPTDASFSGSTFSHGRAGASHVATYWEVDTSGGDFSTPVADNDGEEGAPSTLTSFIAEGLSAGTAYIVRVQYEDEEGNVSPWSASVAFTTPGTPSGGDLPNTPTVSLESAVLADPGSDFDSRIRAAFAISGYFSPIGSPHARTQWQLIADPTDALNWSAFNLLDSDTQFFPGVRWDPAVLLEQGVRYRVRARVQDAAGNFSAWSTPLVYDSLEILAPPVITSPRAGEPVAGTFTITWTERRRTGEDESAYTYRAQYTQNDGSSWLDLFEDLEATEYEWDVSGLTNSLGYQIRIRTEFEGSASAWHFSPWFAVDNDEDIIDVWEPDPSDLSIGSWTRVGDLAQTWGTSGDYIVRNGPPVDDDETGRASGFSVLGYPADTDAEVEISATFRFLGEGVNGNNGPSGANRFLPQEFTRAGVGTAASGTWTSNDPGENAAFPPTNVTGIAAVVTPGSVWGISSAAGQVGGNQFGRSADAVLELHLPMEYSTTPGGSLTRATIEFPYGQRSFVHLVNGGPQWMSVRLRVTVLSVNADTSPYPGRYTLRVQAAYHAQYGEAGQRSGWPIDRTLYNCDLDEDGLIGLAGFTLAERLSNDNVAQAQFRDLSIAGVVTTPCADGFDVTFFNDDGLIPLVGSADSGGFVAEASYYTGTGCPRPWMKIPDRWGDVQIDFRTGSADTGAMTVEVVDKRTDPADQATGHITANVAGRCVNRRAVVRRFREDLGVHVVVLDGICTGYSIESGSVVTYRFNLRDTRDRERIPLFERNETLSLFPERGPILGYGADDFAGTGATGYLLPPVSTFVGNYVANDSNSGSLPTSIRSGRVGAGLFSGFPALDFSDGSSYYPDVTIRWRSTLITAPEVGWTYLRNMPAPDTDQWTVWNAFGNLQEISEVAAFFTDEVASAVDGDLGGLIVIGFTPLVNLYFASEDAADLPGDGQLIEVQVLHAGEPTEDLPLYYDGTFGDLLRRVWDGEYNITDPRIRYDEDRLEFLSTATPRARMIVTERAESMKDWLADNVFAPIGYAPRFDTRGLLYPVSDAIPPIEFLPELDADNVVFEGTAWDHSADNAVHEVDFTYRREFLADVDGTDILTSQEIRARIISPTARDVMADPVEYNPVTVRSTGSGPGAVIGDVSRELGAILARQRADVMLNRYRYGAPVLSARVRSGDPVAAALLPGDWVRVTLSWLPDYATSIRGIDRVMQVIGTVDDDVATRTLTLEDGYSVDDEDIPVLPTFGSITFDSAGRAVAPILAVPSGGTVRVEYAVQQLQPAEDSSEWLLGAVLTTPGNVTSTVVPPGGNVWFRARAFTAAGEPSAWVVAAAVQAGVAPFAFSFTITPQGSGYVAAWSVTPQTLGVRIDWGVHDPLVAVTYTDTIDLPAATASTLISPTVNIGQRLTVRLTPWSDFDAGAGEVSGSPGTPIVATFTRVDVSQSSLTSAAVINTGPGTCPTGLPLTVSWTGGGTGYATDYTITVQRRVTALFPFVFENLLDRATGLDPSVGSYSDIYANHTRDDAGGQFTTFDYRIRLIHIASGLIVSEVQTNAIGVNCTICP